MWKKLLEAGLVALMEEVFRRLIPLLLPYFLFAIFLALTVQLLWSKPVKLKIEHLFMNLRGQLIRISYVATAILVVGLIGFYWWGARQLASVLTREDDGFHVNFKTEIIDMRRTLDGPILWVLYKGGYDDTISPVALTEFLEITSLYNHPVNISSYTTEIKTEDCGWVYLTPLNSKTLRLLWGTNGLNSAPVIKLGDNVLSEMWTKPIPAKSTQFGMLLFDSKVKCDVHEGSTVQFKIDLTESTGRSLSYASPPMSVQKNMVPGNSTGEENVAYF